MRPSEIENRAAHSASNTLANFYIPDGRPMNAAVVPNCLRIDGGATIEVETVRLDDDTEGAEAHVRERLRRTLEANPNIRVFMEFNPRRVKFYDPRMLLQQVENQGFKLGIVGYDGGTIRATSDMIMDRGDNVGPRSILIESRALPCS